MQQARVTTLFLLLLLSASRLQAQTTPPDPESVKSSVEQIFELATMGAVAVQEQAAEVTQHGADYLVRLPLTGFLAPSDAAINAVARPTDHGMLDIMSMTFPSAGTIAPPNAGDPPMHVTYSIGEQRMTAKVDPSLAKPSSYDATFGHVRLVTESSAQHIEQTIDHYALNGAISAEADSRVTMTSQGSGAGFRLNGHGPQGFASDATIRTIAGHFMLEGLDRAQGVRLMAAVRAVNATTAPPKALSDPPDTGITLPRREALRAVIDAVNGLMNRLQAEEVLEDLHFAFGAGPKATGGTISRLRLNLTGDATNDRLAALWAITIDGLSTTAVPVETAAFIPHHLELKTILRDIQTGQLKELARQATEPDADPAVLQTEAMALLADPQAHIAIESLAFDSGPLQIKASAKVVPGADGQLGAEVHVVATGMDLLLAQAQTQPKLQGAMPMIFMAKGMGRPEGQSLVWDIKLGNGPITVNGTPVGQPPGSTR